MGDTLPGQFPPTFLASGETFTVPANTQVLFTLPIELDGTAALAVDGILIEMT